MGAADYGFDVADDEWMIGIGLIGAEIILDDLENYLAEGSLHALTPATGVRPRP